MHNFSVIQEVIPSNFTVFDKFSMYIWHYMLHVCISEINKVKTPLFLFDKVQSLFFLNAKLQASSFQPSSEPCWFVLDLVIIAEDRSPRNTAHIM